MTDHIFSEDDIEAAWQQARPAPGFDARLFRIVPDILQSVIRRDRFNVCGEFGWRIEHGKPVSYRAPALESTMRLMQQETYAAARAGARSARKSEA